MNFSDLIIAPDPSKHMVGITGEYFVCGELGKIDILALLTPKNNPLFDIIATNKTGDKHLIISVKTMGIENNSGWVLGKEFTRKRSNNNFFVVLVNLKIRGSNEYYVYLFDDLVERICDRIRRLKNRNSKDKGNWLTFNLIDFDSNDHNRKNNWTLIQHHLQ